MKLTFTGDSLHEIHQQIISAAGELAGNTTPKEFVNTNTGEVTALHAVTPSGYKSPIEQVDEHADWEEYDKAPVVIKGPEAPVNPTKIDGYNISDGKVWVPVEGRGSAYTGVDVDEYLKRKAAKESGGELDAAGTPYNPAIHTSTKAKTQKGLWKNRPGGAAKVADTPAETPQAQWQQATTEPSKPATVQEVVTHEDSAPAIGRAPAMHNYESFKTNLMTIVVKLINENKITRDYMKDLNAYFQVSNLWDVKNDDTKCQQLFKLFLEYQFIMGA